MASSIRNNWLIIGISGVTCGGKTTLAKNISDKLKNCAVINQDTYFYPEDSPHHVKVTNLNHNNYDVLSALDMGKMYADILSVISKSASLKMDKNILIIEGFTVLNYKPIADLCDLKYQLFLAKDDCIKRRDTRVYDPPDIPGYFEMCVWPEYCKHLAELENVEGIVFLDGKSNNLCDIVLNDINAHK